MTTALVGFSAAAILCTSLTLIVGEDGMMAGWWRLPFIMTLFLGLVALWMGRHLEEPETFTSDSAHTTTNSSAWGALRTLISTYPGQLMKLIGFVILINVAFYLVLTYMPSVMLIQQGSLWSQLAGLGILGLFLVMMISTISATLPALFRTAVRYSGFAIGYNLSTALFGGTTGVANEAIIAATGNVLVPGWYLTIAGAIGLISVLTFTETAGRGGRGADRLSREVVDQSRS